MPKSPPPAAAPAKKALLVLGEWDRPQGQLVNWKAPVTVRCSRSNRPLKNLRAACLVSVKEGKRTVYKPAVRARVVAEQDGLTLVKLTSGQQLWVAVDPVRASGAA